MQPVQERLWRKVTRGIPDECWPWVGACVPKGYGHIRVKTATGWTMAYTHRIAYALAHGEIPAGMLVLHRCDNPPCCNPAHLFLGTQADNVQDMIDKGRQAADPRPKSPRRGERHYMTRLVVADVLAIRADRRSCAVTAKDYGITDASVWAIRARKTWKHVP